MNKNRPAFDALIKFYPLALDDLPGEVWLPVPSYEGYYVSNFGRIKSFKRGKAKILKPALSTPGYLQAVLQRGGKQKCFFIHQLVAKAFIPHPDNKPQVNHKDGCKFNNHVSNLEWATSAENIHHAIDAGLKKSGQEHGRAKLTNEQILFIRENPLNLNTAELAKKFNVGRAAISKIQLGKLWRQNEGSIRQSKAKRISAEVKAQIRAEYQKGVVGYGCEALAKKYGVSPRTIFNIVHE